MFKEESLVHQEFLVLLAVYANGGTAGPKTVLQHLIQLGSKWSEGRVVISFQRLYNAGYLIKINPEPVPTTVRLTVEGKSALIQNISTLSRVVAIGMALFIDRAETAVTVFSELENTSHLAS